MLFSCKISNSLLSYFERRGEDTSVLLDSTTLPEELLTDPNYWMQAADMEKFLSTAVRAFAMKDEGDLLQTVGHLGPEIRSWGVLDSVLRMMPRPQEIFAQPERFLSYFISPQPPVANILRSESGLEFDLPISSDQYPCVTAYLKHAFEALPVFVGKNLANCSWEDFHLKLDWQSQQSSIFAEEEIGHQVSPELLRTVVSTLEKNQMALEERNRELQARNEELLQKQKNIETKLQQTTVLEKVPSPQLTNYDFIDPSSIQTLRHELSRLSDYMVRAQQLITLLVGQDRLTPSVKEAIRRTDWDMVKEQFPHSIQSCRQVLDHTEKKHSPNQEINRV
ncbi:MAG: hypothetical protein BroJett040_19920 [Oligoflexia bacterium]|nr:MAG: hypothetical protein BroJett040_19920 [Oligoflexia bacterium]